MKNKRFTIKQYAVLYDTNRMYIYRMVKKKKLEYDINEKGVIIITDNKWNKGVMSVR